MSVTTTERKLFVESWPKNCSCGVKISEEQWEKLRYAGIQTCPPDYGLPELELRNCASCGSTMAIAVSGDFVENA